MKKEDLIGKFHAHLTIPESYLDKAAYVLNKRKIKHKVTVIDLYANDNGVLREQRHAMITSHYHTFRYQSYLGVEESVLKMVRALQESKIPVHRIKIEHEDLPTLAPTVYTYRECHIKIGFRNTNFKSELELLKMDTFLKDFRFSNNPHSSDSDFIYQFMNLRTRSGTILDFDSRIDLALQYLISEYPMLKISKPKIETTVIDTRMALDNWWA